MDDRYLPLRRYCFIWLGLLIWNRS